MNGCCVVLNFFIMLLQVEKEVVELCRDVKVLEVFVEVKVNFMDVFDQLQNFFFVDGKYCWFLFSFLMLMKFII